MANQPVRDSLIKKLISDPYHEWTTSDDEVYSQFGQWLDNQLHLLEMQYTGWETPGYGHWRRSFSRREASHETEAGTAE